MATVQITLNVINNNDNTPIAGARVYINGSANFDPNTFTVVTDANGNASFSIPYSLTGSQLQVTAAGFSPGGQLVNGNIPQSVRIVLSPIPVSTAVLSFQFIPQVPGILWTLTDQNDNQPAAGVSNPDGTSSSSINSPIPFGTYTVGADLATYQHFSQSITVNGQTSPYTFSLVALVNTDSVQQGNTNGSSTAITQLPTGMLSQSTTQAVSSEYLYPNSDYDKYFTITGVCICIGSLFIDECNSIQYAVQDNAIPIYGYASRYVDAYGQGRSLVQGQLNLNFVSEGYLYTVLREYKKLMANTNNIPTLASTADMVGQVLSMINTRNGYNQQAINNPSTGTNNPATLAANLQTLITSLTKGMTAAQTASLNTKLAAQNQSTVSTSSIKFDNAVYQDVLFDIHITMGNEVTGVQRTRYIEKCKLISNEQIIASDGQTLLDSYGFIGRRLR